MHSSQTSQKTTAELLYPLITFLHHKKIIGDLHSALCRAASTPKSFYLIKHDPGECLLRDHRISFAERLGEVTVRLTSCKTPLLLAFTTLEGERHKHVNCLKLDDGVQCLLFTSFSPC